MAKVKEWAVYLAVTTEHTYTVVARTAEEAISIAEDLYDADDVGSIASVNIESSDAVPMETYAEQESYDEGEELPFES